jgi:hypothetical protein
MSFEKCLLAAQGYLELGMPVEAVAELDSMPAEDRGMICMGALGCMKPAELMSVGPCVASILMGTA